MAIDPATMQAYLDQRGERYKRGPLALQQATKQQQLRNPNWQDFVPGKLKTDADEVVQQAGSTFQNYNNLASQGRVQSVAASGFQRANRLAQQQLDDANKMLAAAKKAEAEQAKSPLYTGTVSSGGSRPATYKSKVAGLGPNTNPAAVKGYDPNAKLGSYNWHGQTLTLNSSVASNFIGVLDGLYAAGYRPKNIGSYANRKAVDGSGAPSLHSLGLAIDVDPGSNPYGGVAAHTIPDNAGAIAAKYGLTWGGNWTSKKDYMHFSLPVSLQGWGVRM